MSKKPEKPMQFLLPFAGGVVNQCYYVSEDELEEKDPSESLPALLEKALAGRLSARALSRSRDALLREAVSEDRAEALPLLMPHRRMELERFYRLFAYAEQQQAPDVLAWLLDYRGAHYSAAEFDAYQQRQLDLEFGLTEPDAAELRRMFRLRYLRSGVCVLGVKAGRRSYEIPAAIGDKPVAGVDAASFYALDPLPRVRRAFPGGGQADMGTGKDGTILLGRSMPGKGAPEAPLVWRVLRREPGRMLVLSERAVALLPYHPEQQEVTWESCRLRRWLNMVFLPLSFPEEERAAILPGRVETPDNPNFGSTGGEATEDRLFLLSAEEASALLADDAARALGRWWWLRTPGFDNSFAATVTPDGRVSRLGSFTDAEDYAVRPAMWVKTEG